MSLIRKISVFEHDRLRIGEQGFSRAQLDALLKLNEYHEGKYFEPISKGVKFNQYVGVIQVDGLTIEINPKSDKYDDDAKWKGVLINMLQVCGRMKPDSSGAAHVKRQHLNLLEVYFELYLSELDSLLRKGFVKQYRKETKNSKVLKGKLEFSGNLRLNAIHKERFYTTHQVYDTDHLLHQVLFKALEIVDAFSKGTRLNDLCKRVVLNYPTVTKKPITVNQIDSIRLNRKSMSYSYALELARLIILNYSPDIASGKEKMLSLLFDMNQLWEEYVLKLIQKAAIGSDIEVTGQESLSFWGSNTLRPDIVIRKASRVYIIDTKWKRPQNSSASISDLRQMYTYCRFWNAEKALLLYPGDTSENEFLTYETDDYSIKDNELKPIDHKCKMGFVSVLDDDNIGLDMEIGDKILDLLFKD